MINTVFLDKIRSIYKLSFVSNFISLVILQGANYIFPLLTVPYLFRILGAENFGLINFANAFVAYFIIFTDFGFGISAVKNIAVYRDDIKKRNLFFTNIFIAKLFLFLISALIFGTLIISFDKFSSHKAVYVLAFINVLGTSIFPFWFFQGIERMKYVTNISITTRICSIIPIFLVVKSDADYLYVPFFYSLGSIASGIIGLYCAYKYCHLRFNFLGSATIAGVRDSLKESFNFFISRISVSLYTISNTFVLGLVLGNTAVGYYTAAEKLYTALQSMYGPLNQALYPYMVKTKDRGLFKKVFIGIVVINCIVLPICIYESNWIMNIIYKSINTESIVVFQILLIASLLTIPSILLGYPFLGAFGFTRYTNNTVILSSIFHISVLLLLVAFGMLTIYNVAALVVITEMMVLILRVRGAQKYIINPIS